MMNEENRAEQREFQVNEMDNSNQEDQGPTSTSYIMEGYTPLNFDMNALANNDDSDSDGHHDSDVYTSGYYQLNHPGNKRVNGVKTHVGEFTSQFREENHSDDDDSDGFIPADFQALADQALLGLEEEHRVTVERSEEEELVDSQTQAMTSDVAEDHHDISTSADKTPVFEVNFPSCEEIMSMHMKPNEKPAAAPTQAPKKFPVARMNTTKTKSKERNLNAIQEAMRSIRTTAPNFASVLDARSSASSTAIAYETVARASYKSTINSTCLAIKKRQQTLTLEQKLSVHPIIPMGPLAAFRRNTQKARLASHNLSRSATLSEAVYRLWPLICFRKKLFILDESEWLTGQPKRRAAQDKNLTIHIIGADGVECSSEDSVRNSVGSFVRWLDAALQADALPGSFRELSEDSDGIMLTIEFSGPNMPDVMIGRTIDLLPQTQSNSQKGLKSATCGFHSYEYHGSNRNDFADLTIAFNAGIW
eukprot:scaffold73286_cov36-Cyclotella_meneghiniana.AAC.2